MDNDNRPRDDVGMNKCIYYKDGNLSFDSREHIIPASVGGIRKLPKGFVSDKANNYFSGIELVALRETFVGGIRNYIGPGHRGKRLNVSNEGVIQCSSKYNPHLNVLKVRNDIESAFSYKLGFMYDKHIVFIPQVLFYVDNQLKLEKKIYSPGGYDNPLNNVGSFFEYLKKMVPMDSEIVTTELLCSEAVLIVGCFYSKWYHFCNIPFLDFEKAYKICTDQIDDINLIISLDRGKQYDYSYRLSGGLIHGELQFIYLKTAFNVLAYVMGQDYVLDERFDFIRNIIMGKSKVDILRTCEPCKATKWISNLDLVDPHVVIFETIEGILFAVVSFYGELCYVFTMANELDESISFAYVCDWRNRHEYVVNPWN